MATLIPISPRVKTVESAGVFSPMGLTSGWCDVLQMTLDAHRMSSRLNGSSDFLSTEPPSRSPASDSKSSIGGGLDVDDVVSLIVVAAGMRVSAKLASGCIVVS